MAQKPDPLAWDSVGPQKRAPHLLADHDENLVTIAQEIPDPPSVYSGDTRGKHAQRSQWGNVFNVQAGATAVGVLTPALTTPHLDAEQDLTLLLQVQPQNPFFPYYIVAAQITYGVGAAVLTKTVYLHNANLVRVQLCARNVQVSLQVLQTTHFMSIPVSGDVNVTCAVVPGHTYLRDGYTWSPGNTITLTAFGDLWPANGTLGVQQYPTYGSVGLLTATLTAASSPGSPLYVLLFDTASGLIVPDTTAPIPFGCSPALYNVGDSVTFSGLEAPEALTFTSGLQATLSTTADVQTAPAGGNAFRVDCLIGL